MAKRDKRVRVMSQTLADALWAARFVEVVANVRSQRDAPSRSLESIVPFASACADGFVETVRKCIETKEASDAQA